MDYYSGSPDVQDYDFNNVPNNSNRPSFFNRYSKLLLWIIALAIIGLILLMVFTKDGNAPKYNAKDNNSSLSSIEVDGASISPSFDSATIKYKLYPDSDVVTFTCAKASEKSTVQGCETVDLNEVKSNYEIKVTAENGDVTIYYFTIVK